MTKALWRRPEEVGRRFLGNFIEYLGSATAIASAVSVAIGPGETLEGKICDALVIPNVLDGYHRAKYIWDHQQQIANAADYLVAHTPEQLQHMITKVEIANAKLHLFTKYVTLAKDNLVPAHLHPLDAYDNAKNAFALLPDLPNGFESIRVLSEHTAHAIEHIRNFNYVPAYNAIHALRDNFSRDEWQMTVGVMAVSAAVIVGASTYIGSVWSRRGIPSLKSKLQMSWGARRHPKFYRDNARWIFGEDVYNALEEHFREKYRKK